MNKRTMLRSGASIMLAALLAVGGCGGSGGSAGTTGGGAPAEKQKDATAALTAAANELQKDTYKSIVNLGAQGTMVGVADPKSKSTEFVMESTAEGSEVTTTLRVVGGVTYMKIKMADAGGLPGFDGKKWRKLSGAGAAGTLGNFDATQMSKSLESATEVQWAGDGTVKGTLDLAKSAEQLGLAGESLGQLATTKIPFEATIDGDGRLVAYKFTMPAIGTSPAYDFDMKFSDFGTPVDIKAPAAADITAS